MSQRISKVNELLKREIITCIERNFEFTDLLVTIHGVDTAPNLRSAKVYVGVIGDENSAKGVLAKLNRKSGFIQNEMMKRVILRNTPMLTFVGDNSVERGVHIINLLDELGEIEIEDEEKV
jgi:ribosome-binding factor A